MTINEKIISNKELKISDWELDFYSRPIIENNGKKRWELIISSSKSFKTEKIFLWNKVCPANEVNSIWLTNCLLYTSPSPRDTTASRMPSSA